MPKLNKIEQLIINDKIEEAVNEMLDFAKNNNTLSVVNELKTILAKYKRITKEKRLGISSNEEHHREINKLTYALIEIKSSLSSTSDFKHDDTIPLNRQPKWVLSSSIIILIIVSILFHFWYVKDNDNPSAVGEKSVDTISNTTVIEESSTPIEKDIPQTTNRPKKQSNDFYNSSPSTEIAVVGINQQGGMAIDLAANLSNAIASLGYSSSASFFKPSFYSEAYLPKLLNNDFEFIHASRLQENLRGICVLKTSSIEQKEIDSSDMGLIRSELNLMEIRISYQTWVYSLDNEVQLVKSDPFTKAMKGDADNTAQLVKEIHEKFIQSLLDNQYFTVFD